MNEGITGWDKAYHVVYLSIPENVAAERKLPAPSMDGSLPRYSE